MHYFPSQEPPTLLNKPDCRESPQRSEDLKRKAGLQHPLKPAHRFSKQY